MEIESHMSLLTFPNSGNTYYFRSFIPADLIEYFGGVKEFRISLKCAIKSLKNSMRETKWSGLIKPVEVMGKLKEMILI